MFQFYGFQCPNLIIVKMSVKGEHICRLCLKVTDNEFDEIDENMSQTFDILLLELDLHVTEDPIICQDCLEVAKKCVNFKYTCINTEEIILSYSTAKKKAKCNINVIYKARKCTEKVFEDVNICRICMAELRKYNFVFIDTLMNENRFEVLSAYLPEMDFKLTEDPIICTNCRQKLQSYFNFAINCMNIEDKIKTYCRKEETASRGQVKLSDIKIFLSKDVLEYSEKCVTKEELNTFEDTESVYLEASSGLLNLEENMDIKEEEINLKENCYDSLSGKRLDKCHDTQHEDILEGDGNDSDMQINKFAVCAADKREKKKGKANLTNSNTSEANTCKYKLCISESNIQRTLKNHMRNRKEANQKDNVNEHMSIQGFSSVHKEVSELKMYKCSICTYENKHKNNLKRHMVIHKDVAELKMYKCALCAYDTKRKNDLKRHMFIHKDASELKMYKCSLCAYEAKRKYALRSHMLIHKDASEIKTYKCLLCSYEAKRKIQLKRHMLVHKDASEINTYKCSVCPYEAKRKGNLDKHMFFHKDPSELKMYKCSFCAYEAKQKNNLKRHMFVHKDVTELKMYKCLLCAYESKQRSYLEQHTLVHKDASEIKMYNCASCDYEAKRKRDLEDHMIIHKNASQLNMYKCPMCAYEAKRKNNLKNHMVLHKDASELNTYKCSLCAYETKLKSRLKGHMFIHKDASEIKMYKCPLCIYEAKRKGDLEKHKFIHKDESELKMYKCTFCAYKAKYKCNLDRHAVTHKDASELKIYKCSLCAYEAKQKRYLKQHMLNHNKFQK